MDHSRMIRAGEGDQQMGTRERAAQPHSAGVCWFLQGPYSPQAQRGTDRARWTGPRDMKQPMKLWEIKAQPKGNDLIRRFSRYRDGI